jgi:hypothetical protein
MNTTKTAAAQECASLAEKRQTTKQQTQLHLRKFLTKTLIK